MSNYFQELAASFSHPVTAIAQCLGFIPVVLGFFVFRNISRRASIVIKAASDFLAAVHFLLLGAITGSAINFINTARDICFAQKGRQKWASGIWMPAIFCGLTAVGSILSWTGLISLLPLLGSCLAVVGYWCSDPKKLRAFNFVGIFLWLIYCIQTFSLPSIVGNSISLFSIVRTEWKLRKKNNGVSHP